MDISSRRRGGGLEVAARIEITKAEVATPLSRDRSKSEISDVGLTKPEQLKIQIA